MVTSSNSKERLGGLAVLAFAACAACGTGMQAQQQDSRAHALVKLAVQTELDASRNDHSHWQYKDVYQGESGEKVMRVIETGEGALKKTVELNGHALTAEELKAEDDRLAALVKDSAQQAKQHKDSMQDDKRAESLLRMLPDAFVWKVNSEDATVVHLGFVPNPAFAPPTMESRVFAAMAGEIVVEKEQHRMQTLRGTLTSDVTFGWGLFGRMKQGGTFEIERRQLASGIWQITESHVHIDGRALLFKTIGEQEDEVKSEFRRVPQEVTLEQAAEQLKGEPSSLNASR